MSRCANSGEVSKVERLQAITEMALRAERITVEELSMRMGVSAATIRRDLQSLQRQGVLRRDHGGAATVEPIAYDSFAQDSSFQKEAGLHIEEKRRIAVAAASLVEDGDALAMTAGTTVTQVARSIPFNRRVTIFTNAVNIAMELSCRQNVTLRLTGGALRGAWFSLVGSEAVASAQQFIADKLFISANAVSAQLGLMDFHVEEAAVNRVLMAHARQRIVVADHTKFGATAPCVVGDAGLIDVIVTDTQTPELELAPFRERGVKILQV